VKLLLDTHYVFGLAGSPGTLSRAEARFLNGYLEPFVVSAVSIWEVRLKWRALDHTGSPKGPASPTEVVSALMTDAIVEFLPLTPVHAVAELRTPLAHRDPFDELLIAQAQAEGMRLLSRDRKLIGHPLVVAAD
jgi:PIN domain nuclease of toxin-antitoxin system